jgi:hypothetical protein
MDLSTLSKSVQYQGLGKIACVFHIIRWGLSTPGSPKYILPIAYYITSSPVSPYACDWLPLAKLNGTGEFLSSLN